MNRFTNRNFLFVAGLWNTIAASDFIWKFAKLFSGYCQNQPTTDSMFSLWRRKIYLSFASLAFGCHAEVEPSRRIHFVWYRKAGRSATVRTIAKKRRRIKKRRNNKKGERKSSLRTMCIYIHIYTRIRLCIIKGIGVHTPYETLTSKQKWHVIWKYSPPTSSRITDQTSLNRDTTGGIFHNIVVKSVRACVTRNLYTKPVRNARAIHREQKREREKKRRKEINEKRHDLDSYVLLAREAPFHPTKTSDRRASEEIFVVDPDCFLFLELDRTDETDLH